MRKDDLYMLAKEKGLSVTRKTTKETLIALLKEGDYSPVKEKEPAFGPCTEK